MSRAFNIAAAALIVLVPLAFTAESHADEPLFVIKTSLGKNAQLVGTVKDDDNISVQNPSLVVNGKSYHIAHNSGAVALNDLVCRHLVGNEKFRYSRAKFQKLPRRKHHRAFVLAIDNGVNTAKPSRTRTVVQNFQCIEN